MIILDTNVVSEPMKPGGSAAVLTWLDRQIADTLYLTTTSLAELLAGVEMLPHGKRRDGLAASLHDLLNALFADRILPFDGAAAHLYAEIAGQARKKGVAISFADGQIASIAAAHGFSIATRDRMPFEAAGITVIDPWQDVYSVPNT